MVTASTGAGALSLTENSLYTREAFGEYVDHLTDDGLLTITRWVFDGLRLVSLAQEAGATVILFDREADLGPLMSARNVVTTIGPPLNTDDLRMTKPSVCWNDGQNSSPPMYNAFASMPSDG